MMNVVSAPGGRSFCKERGYIFAEEFRDYVENGIMKREPYPEAKPMGAFSIGRPPGDSSA